MKLFLIFLSLFISLQTISAQDKENSEYFEGFIDYKATFKSYLPGVSDKEMQLRIGSDVRIYFKGGSFKWFIKDDVGYLKSYIHVDEKSNLYYYWSEENPDTLLSFNLNSTKRLLVDKESIKEDGVDTVCGHKCRVVKFEGINYYENPSFNLPTSATYYFCPDYKVNPALYQYYKEMRWNELVAAYKSIALKMVTDYGAAFTATYAAIKITPEKIGPDIFLVDKTKIIKPTFVD